MREIIIDSEEARDFLHCLETMTSTRILPICITCGHIGCARARLAVAVGPITRKIEWTGQC